MLHQLQLPRDGSNHVLRLRLGLEQFPSSLLFISLLFGQRTKPKVVTSWPIKFSDVVVVVANCGCGDVVVLWTQSRRQPCRGDNVVSQSVTQLRKHQKAWIAPCPNMTLFEFPHVIQREGGWASSLDPICVVVDCRSERPKVANQFLDQQKVGRAWS